MIEPPWRAPIGPELWKCPTCYVSLNCHWEYPAHAATQRPPRPLPPVVGETPSALTPAESNALDLELAAEEKKG